jgi:hypothetical protein
MEKQMNKETGGPALTTEQSEKQVAIQLGGEVLLRDYFAAKAMQGYLMAENGAMAPDELIAKGAYVLADAMLIAREQ